MTGPDGSFGPAAARNWGYWVRVSAESDICQRGCAYTVFQAIQRHRVYSAVYGNVSYKEPLKSFEKSRT